MVRGVRLSQDADDVSHPFVYANGKLTSLGTYNIDTTPQAINDAGVIVGTTYGVDASGNPFTHAFIYQGGTFQDLDTLIPANSGWQLTDAVGINTDGRILVDATNTTTGQDHALCSTRATDLREPRVPLVAGHAAPAARRGTPRALAFRSPGLEACAVLSRTPWLSRFHLSIARTVPPGRHRSPTRKPAGRR